jgi:hypothetical protein
MTSLSSKALRTDPHGLAFLRAVLRGTPASNVPAVSPVAHAGSQKPANPNQASSKALATADV